jgi:hippurate hydrolase
MITNHLKQHESALIAIRHDLHAHPELCFDEHRTSAIVATELKRLGFEVTTGIAKTGVIGTLCNGNSNRAIGLRADMDALPIHETTNLPYASKTPDKMHACGHDGHTASLLGAARYLAETRNFNGTAHLIFQPAEEDISGAKLMLEEGLITRFPMDAVYAFHNIPGVPVGQVKVKAGAITTEVAIVQVTVKGIGGHGALPHLTADPIVTASAIVMALQSIVSRNIDPADIGIITVGAIHGGVLGTIIPEEVKMTLGVRTVSDAASQLMAKRVPEVISATAKAHGCTVDIDYGEGIIYPAGINAQAASNIVRELAIASGQSAKDIDMTAPFMFSEDFAFIQQKIPSCYFGLGNGNSRSLHDPGYNFNDALIIPAASFMAGIVEATLKS